MENQSPIERMRLLRPPVNPTASLKHSFIKTGERKRISNTNIQNTFRRLFGAARAIQESHLKPLSSLITV